MLQLLVQMAAISSQMNLSIIRQVSGRNSLEKVYLFLLRFFSISWNPLDFVS
jgi:hypothetical protein